MKKLLINLLFVSILFSTVTPVVIAERAPTFYVEDFSGHVQTFEDYSFLPEDAVGPALGTSEDVSTKPEPVKKVGPAFSTSEEEESDRPFADRPFANKRVESIGNFEKVVATLMLAAFCYKFFTTPSIQKNLNQLKNGLLVYLPRKISKA